MRWMASGIESDRRLVHAARSFRPAVIMKCDNLGSVQGRDQADGAIDSPLSRRSREVTENLAQAITATERELSRIQESVMLWDSANKMRSDLADWLAVKQTELARLKEKPAKLHVDAAELEVSQLQVHTLYCSFESSQSQVNCCMNHHYSS